MQGLYGLLTAHVCPFPELGSKLSGRVEEALNGGPSSPRANGLPRTPSGNKAGANVDEATRQRVRDRISAALHKNTSVGEAGGRAEQLAAACEEKCFRSCTSRYAPSLRLCQTIHVVEVLRVSQGLVRGSGSLPSLICACRTVYLNKVGNAARVAASLAEADMDELPRIASGEARHLHADSTAGPTAAAAAAGMQGISMKPT